MKAQNSLIPTILLLFLLCSCESSPKGTHASVDENIFQKAEWRALFNHEDLTGWEVLPGGKWEVQDGVIKGTSPADEPLHGILLSDKQFSNFKLKVIYKANKGNSGVYFRVEKVPDAVHVFGFQAEIDPEKDAGGLYETGGRAWVVQPSQEDFEKWYITNFRKNISLEEVAEVAHLSVTSFCRFFKACTRKSFSQFLNEIRIGYACKLLLEEGHNVSQVCFESGFNNMSNFNRQFKKIIGKSPLQYKNQSSL